jgi:hypothetical protein
MSESNWGESEAPPPKKRVPTWLWACGGGCLLALVLGIAGGTYLFVKFKKAVEEGQNPDIQWPRVAEALPYDNKPADTTLQFGLHLGFVDMYIFSVDHQDSARPEYSVILYQINALDKEKSGQALDPSESGGFMNQGKRRNMKSGTVRVQGRDLKALRFDQMDDDEKQAADGMPKPGKGPSIMLDLTSENGTHTLLLQMIRLDGTDPIEDEAVQRFLKPFHVGPDR